MIYTVEMALKGGESDETWDRWFGDMKPLSTFETVPGFLTAQRFKGLGKDPAPSLGYYSVASADVLDSEAYYANNGGKMRTPSWRPMMSYWHRNLFSGIDAPELVPEGRALLAYDSERQEVPVKGPDWTWLTAAGLDSTVPFRAVAVMPEGEAQRFLDEPVPGLTVFVPRGPQFKFF